MMYEPWKKGVNRVLFSAAAFSPLVQSKKSFRWQREKRGRDCEHLGGSPLHGSDHTIGMV